MPSIEAEKKDLEKLVGKKFLDREELGKALEYAKCELDSIEGDKLVIGANDTNRPDLLSTEGIARELRSHFAKDTGVPKYKVKTSGVSLIVNKNVAKIRPCIAAAIVKNVRVSKEFLVQMIQLQEKVCLTFGRKRKEAAIGLYEWEKLEAPMHYRAFKPRELKFVPLECKTEMHLDEILLEHPKGKEYAHLLKGFDKYPILVDSKGVVASMPPIINSQITGKVSEATKEVLVEVTGQKQETVNTALNVMVSALAERNFDVYSVKIKYPGKTITTPDFKPKKIVVNLESIKKLSGLDLKPRQIIELLEKARYNAKQKKNSFLCEYPAYRLDILHEVDVIEDVIISLGYNRIEPLPVELPGIGSESAEAEKTDSVREICVGTGLQEILTFTLTSREKQEQKLSLREQEFVEIANPVSANYGVFRKSVLPELLEFLGKNKHCLFPQNIFEIGKCFEIDNALETRTREPIKLCIVLSGKNAEFTAIKSVLGAVCSNIGVEYALQESDLPFLEKGKQGEILIGTKKGFGEANFSKAFESEQMSAFPRFSKANEVSASKSFASASKGFVGEVNKKTLVGFGLEMPTACIEIEI